MATTLSEQGWFSNRRAATGASSGLGRAANLVTATVLISAGTGALVDEIDWWRQYRPTSLMANPLRPNFVEIASVRTPAQNLARIRDVISPAVSELASACKVSRQAIYNWLNGEQPKPDHIEKLRDLAHAADIVSEAGIPITGAFLKRKVIDGKNLFEVVHDGGSARDAMQLLVQTVRHEAEQRERLAMRFAGRKPSSRSADSDFPAENDAR
jgi:transcriptional regulator with XRE-family HTH domain